MKTWFLPPSVPPPPTTFRTLGGLELESPAATPELLRAAVAALARGRPALLALKTDLIVRALDEALAEWIAPASGARRAAEEAFRAATGIPAATAPFGPPLEACAGGALRAWLRAEIAPLEALDGFAPDASGRLVRAVGPRLAVHVLPGNVPLVWLPGILACLAMRTPCLLKPAADDPLTPALFAETVARISPALAGALAVVPWTGGDAVAAEADKSPLVDGLIDHPRRTATRAPHTAPARARQVSWTASMPRS